ncbi:Gfo/Idh/MocA family protein [Cohnella rhizosphaerae]|uniref:Gfo/Idh/MocA family oxidoreductase n=1 Tax=Cohnella rhizosphaerae TaxID=1457232 RepID=A0A9X4KWV6_9BACL|nr:Gfo/Idh/MocA family oxidoreductase [Cohnella rhizosphaerae]MDG0812766.1 Gfo/Idh/MocA family oxidoreductase [Cohnella rhizosphaerae]
MEQKVLKIGLIGLGEVAQVIHLPVLELYPECFRISAICDISPKLVESIGRKYRVDNLYTDAHELVRQPDLDVVFVLNSNEYHAECAIAAADAGKHVLIEKPMCLTRSEAEAIVEARDRNNVLIMVGYMRRYAAPFVQAVQEIKQIDRIHYARVRDIIGPNSKFINPVSRVLRFDDVPASSAADRRERSDALMLEAVGEKHDGRYASLYGFLCGLSSHDLSSMREAIGMPVGVVGANRSKNGNFLNVIFDYESFTVTFETGVDDQGRFDAHIEVYGANKSVKVQYNTPYIRHLPTLLHITESGDEHFAVKAQRPTFKDPYRLQLEHLYDAVTQGTAPKTTPEDYMEDLKLF